MGFKLGYGSGQVWGSPAWGATGYTVVDTNGDVSMNFQAAAYGWSTKESFSDQGGAMFAIGQGVVTAPGGRLGGSEFLGGYVNLSPSALNSLTSWPPSLPSLGDLSVGLTYSVSITNNYTGASWRFGGSISATTLISGAFMSPWAAWSEIYKIQAQRHDAICSYHGLSEGSSMISPSTANLP